MNIRILFSFLMVVATCSAFGQKEIKLGHVNTESVFNALPELAEVEKQLDAEYTKQETQLTTLQEELKKQQEEYVKVAETLSNEVRTEKETALMEMNQRVQNFYKLAQQILQSKEQELKMPLIDKVQKAIQEVGEENGFLYIFEVNSGLPVYHSEKSIDVEPLVKAKLGIVK